MAYLLLLTERRRCPPSDQPITRAEHYEIATYGTLATFAEVLGLEDAKDLLGQTLEEEKEADETLTGIARQINPEAETEEEEEEEMAMASPRKGSSGGKKR